jgi:hypothetical protein
MICRDTINHGYRGVDWSGGPADWPWVYRISTIDSGARFVAYGLTSDQRAELDAPEHVRLAFRAGDPILPIIDWLIETHGDAHPWLHDLARAAIEAT